MESIRTTEKNIRSNPHSRVMRFRVYSCVNSQAHIMAGADWGLVSSWETEELARAHAKELTENDLWLATIIDGDIEY